LITSINKKRVAAGNPAVLAIAGVSSHQLGPALDGPWPTGEFIQELESRILGDGIEIMFTVNKAVEPLSYQIQIWLEGLIDYIFAF